MSLYPQTKLFLIESSKTNSEIERDCRFYGIENFSIVDGLVNVDGRDLEKIPFKFGGVTGTFDCSNNKITSLEGAPNSVGGTFYPKVFHIIYIAS